jgi:hypothetical protein
MERAAGEGALVNPGIGRRVEGHAAKACRGDSEERLTESRLQDRERLTKSKRAGHAEDRHDRGHGRRDDNAT